MNVTDYTYLINKSNAINDKQTASLEKIVHEFPYFQSAKALTLKGLYNLNSFKYNFALKVAAAHTTDRSVLFDFITSDNFTAIQKEFYDKKTLQLHNIDVIESEIIIHEEKLEYKTNTLEQSILTSIKEALPLEFDDSSKIFEEKLAIGQPLDFSINEKHSFQEWLQLSRTLPIDREAKNTISRKTLPIDDTKKKNAQLIDKFIETSPKIPPVKHGVTSTLTFDLNKDDNSYLMTETLARVYLEQKKYLKAIQAYQILILKYPEKSSFFVDRISDIKILQQNNYNN
ncbi:hypothetical protein [Flavobacterium urumqiense]|uniref:Tetratricopeptide repeat-containing protein n=1 Tax=Flavobacterium urumqiense TaxID=935224 RepID=A0A1H5U034_9FLAO|nr:hypothetical protein [Flavobacterium urumqiense]SEF67798.1 hypothetical protein SAMN04488130_10221 [Flavobacterium urumqiense]